MSEHVGFVCGKLVLRREVVIFTVENKSDMWLVVEDPLDVGDDGVFNREVLSFVDGTFTGRSMHSYGCTMLVPPRSQKTEKVDLQKSYTGIKTPIERPSSNLYLGVSRFASKEVAEDFRRKLASKEQYRDVAANRVFESVLEVPWKY